MSHTPGPWSYEKGTGLIYPSNSTVKHVAHVFGLVPDIGNANKNYDEWEANARLIAAAPDLLEAAKAVIRAFGFAPPEDVDLPTEWDDLSAAVAKAEGTEKPDPHARTSD